MENRLSQNFNTLSLLRFAAPTVVMLMFMSLYQMVDGVFVANFVGETALSALNIVYPVPSVLIAVSIMLATGGNAIIARNMGEGEDRLAKENFSFLVLVGAAVGVGFLVFGLVFLGPLIRLLGATPHLYPYCRDYLLILVLSAPLAVFQMLFQNFFVTAGKPHIGLVLTILGGVANIVLDYVFMAVFHWGVAGAALATSIGYAIPALFGLFYFTFARRGTLYLVRPVFRGRVLLHSCTNSSSEMVNNLAVAVTTFLFNILMISMFMGFSSGIAPVVSYNYGRQNTAQLQKVFRSSVGTVAVASLAVFVVAEFFSEPVIRVFSSSGSEVFRLAKHGFALFSVSFLFTGLNIFASALFTAFSNGRVSAILSFLRTFFFLVVCLLVLPLLWDVDGIWLAVPAAEALAFVVSIVYLVKLRHVYRYHD